MKITVPEYYKSFKCIADKCQDSCCVGWDIDIDEITRAKYAALTCDLGLEIARKSQHGSFLKDNDGRCAFLDECGLCRIISGLGEGYLCDICREHPRYYGAGSDGIDGGLGLCCEEAARIILGLKEKPKLIEIDVQTKYDAYDEYALASNSFRELIYECIYSCDIEYLPTILSEYAIYADNTCFDLVSGIADVSVPISKITAIPCEEKTVDLAKSAIKFFSLCEVLDKSFGEVVLRISEREYKALPRAINENEGVFRNLLFYFTHRHVRECVEDMSLGARILFSLLAAIAVILCAEKIDGDDRYLRSAVAFSKNIEYSTENVDMVLEKISDIL